MNISYIGMLRDKLGELEGLKEQQVKLMETKKITFADGGGKNIFTIRKDGIAMYVDVMNIHLKERIEALALELKEKYGVDLNGEL